MKPLITKSNRLHQTLSPHSQPYPSSIINKKHKDLSEYFSNSLNKENNTYHEHSHYRNKPLKIEKFSP